MQRTIELAKGRDLIEVCMHTKLNYHWVQKFTKGLVADPSVNRVQRLYEYLTGKTLSV